MRRFIPIHPLCQVAPDKWQVITPTVVYVNLDHVISVTVRGRVAFIVMRNRKVLCCWKEDFLQQVDAFDVVPKAPNVTRIALSRKDTPS